MDINQSSLTGYSSNHISSKPSTYEGKAISEPTAGKGQEELAAKSAIQKLTADNEFPRNALPREGMGFRENSPQAGATADATVMKALQSSGFPTTDRNRAIVTELLNQRMPIDKLTLQLLIRLSNMNREAAPLSLVLMLKNNLPITSSNIKQFEAYQAGKHQLLTDIKSITTELGKLLQVEGAVKEASSYTEITSLNQPASLPMEQTISPNQLFKDVLDRNSKLIDLYSNQSLPAMTASEVPLHQILSLEELNLLRHLLEQNTAANPSVSLSSEAFHQIGIGSYSLKDTMDILLNSYGFIEDSLSQPLYPEQLNTLLSGSKPEAELLVKLLEHFRQLQSSSPSLSHILSREQRLNLLQNLSEATDMSGIKDQILKGDILVRDTFEFLKNSFAQMSREIAGRLLQSPEYTKLLQEAFLAKWTLTPKETADKDGVAAFYQRMEEDLKQLKVLAEEGTSIDKSSPLQEIIKNSQDNLQFMKDLNAVFAYLQLPLRLKDREAHAELYVLADKNKRKGRTDNLSVLLHLDMTHLGSLNVHIKKLNQQFQAIFCPEEEATASLIAEGLPSFVSLLSQKGYQFHAEVKKDYAKPDFHKNLMEDNSSEQLIQRYTFDIRT